MGASGYIDTSFLRGKQKISYENFVGQHASKNIFDNDLLDMQYKFWESDEDREKRLKKTWLDMQRRNAIGGVDTLTSEEHQEITNAIVKLMRKVRWKVDQELVRRNKRPLFQELYFGKYEKDEFLIDVDVEFYKVKKLLEKDPRTLRDDPLISLDYHRIIELIR